MGTPEPDSRACKIVETVLTDTQSGAAQLATTALTLVRQWLASDEVSPDTLKKLLTDLAGARPSMVPLANAMERVRQGLTHSQDGASAAEQALPVVDSVLEQIASANRRVAEFATTRVSEQAIIFTHSRSSQVLALFRLLVQQGRNFSVICTQSSPGNEGFTLARELDELGVPVTVITDAQMGLFVPKADLVLCGCDTWLADDYFLNKAGSYPLALLARAEAKPLWVLADSFKDSTAPHDKVTLEEMAANQLDAPAGQHITVRNFYFEPVPVQLISGRISEQGVFSFPAEPGQ